MRLNDKFKFGKYKGQTLESVINKNPAYVKWCVKHLENFKLDAKAEKYLYKDYIGEVFGLYDKIRKMEKKLKKIEKEERENGRCKTSI